MRQRELDPIYFSTRPWARRVAAWVKQARADGQTTPFLDGNLAVIRQTLEDPDAGLRMVVNIGADALLSFLATNDYKNIYEHPVIGGERRAPTKERVEVDTLLDLLNRDHEFYFGAVALAGAGVRFYGDYCMVIKPSRVSAGTRMFDRDSYDLLEPPLTGRSAYRTRRIVGALKGAWGTDLVDMLIMKMLPRLPPVQHLITAGHIAELVMSDQEFVEVHLEDKIRLEHIEEVRQAPSDAAIEAAILNRKRGRRPPTLVEIRWVAQRRRVLGRLAQRALAYRIVTAPGKGYQWT